MRTALKKLLVANMVKFKKYHLLLWCMCVGLHAFAQVDPEQYANGITVGDLKKHLEIIASPEMEGRETATEGQRKAAAYIANEFQKMGLLQAPGTTGYQQFYTVNYDTIAVASFSVNNKEYEYGKDFYTSWQSTFSDDIRTKKIVFVGYGISDSNYNDYKGRNVRGKVVIMFSGEPKKGGEYVVNKSKLASKWTYPGASLKASIAFEKGAKAVILIQPGQPIIRAENVAKKSTVYYPAEEEKKPINIIIASHQVGAEILGPANFERLVTMARNNEPLNKETKKVRKPLSLHIEMQKMDLQSSNVIGFIEGTDKKDEYVILTAHYDHLGKRGETIYFGADDDGSGTVSVIEMAEAFANAKAAGNGPRRSVIFMTVSGEEKGLWGSKYYSDNPLFPLDKTSVNLNIDMVGRIDPKRIEGDSTNYVYVIGDHKLSSDLAGIINHVNEKYSHLEIDRRFNENDPNRYYQRSDHYNFARKGVPIIFYFNGTHADYHKATDSVEKINFELMQKRVRLVFYTAWQIANANLMMKRDLPLD